MNTLDNYEEGHLWVTVRLHWWQFWLPEKVIAGTYLTIGYHSQMYAFGKVWKECPAIGAEE